MIDLRLEPLQCLYMCKYKGQNRLNAKLVAKRSAGVALEKDQSNLLHAVDEACSEGD